MAYAPLELALSQPTNSGGGSSKWARILGGGLMGASFLPGLGDKPWLKNSMLSGGLGMLGSGSYWGGLAGVPSLLGGLKSKPIGPTEEAVTSGLPGSSGSVIGPEGIDGVPPTSLAPGFGTGSFLKRPPAGPPPGAAQAVNNALSPIVRGQEPLPNMETAFPSVPQPPPSYPRAWGRPGAPVPPQGPNPLGALTRARGIGPAPAPGIPGPWDLFMPSKWRALQAGILGR